MAIEMIENNELAALAPSRLGLNEFADDNWAYRNYTGSDEFFNLFGSRKAKKEKYTQQVQQKFGALSTDCENIQTSIDLVNNELRTLLKQKQNLEVKTKVKNLNNRLGELKALQISQKCEKQLAEQQRQAQQEQVLTTLTKLSDVSVGKASDELKGLQGGESAGTDTNKLLLYGGIGVAALVVIILIAKRN